MQRAAMRCCDQMGVGEGFMHLGALWSEGSVTDMGPCGGQYKVYNRISLSQAVHRWFYLLASFSRPCSIPPPCQGRGHRSRRGVDGEESVRNGRGYRHEPIQARPA